MAAVLRALMLRLGEAAAGAAPLPRLGMADFPSLTPGA
jgi:hypothetical protein